MITLASSRATSHMIRSPSGRVEASGTRITSIAEAVSHSSAWTLSARSGGATIRRWTIARSLFGGLCKIGCSAAGDAFGSAPSGSANRAVGIPDVPDVFRPTATRSLTNTCSLR